MAMRRQSKKPAGAIGGVTGADVGAGVIITIHVRIGGGGDTIDGGGIIAGASLSSSA
jgi:hypothetical protein